MWYNIDRYEQKRHRQAEPRHTGPDADHRRNAGCGEAKAEGEPKAGQDTGRASQDHHHKTTKGGASEMYSGWEWSPEAQKARREAQGRARGYWPTLQRTSTHLILRRPTRGGRKYQADFASYVAKGLQQFTFNSERNWWEADLSVANAEAAMEANTNAKLLQLNVSEGVREWLKSNQPGIAAQAGNTHNQ